MNHNTRTANDLGDAGCAWPVEKKGLDALDRVTYVSSYPIRRYLSLQHTAVSCEKYFPTCKRASALVYWNNIVHSECVSN